MKPNYVLNAWRNKKQTLGAWVGVNSINVAESMAHSGFDWLVIDCQHGLIEMNALPALIAAINTTNTVPFVRVKSNNFGDINKALDSGALGVIVPMINNAEEARAAVDAMRYPSSKGYGKRSTGPTRPMMAYGNDYLYEANENVACILQIETKDGLANVEEIAAVPGVDCLYVGPTDLAFGLGLFPGGEWEGKRNGSWFLKIFQQDSHKKALKTILDCCHRHNIAGIMHTLGINETSKMYIKDGWDGIMSGSAKGWMSRGAGGALRELRPMVKSIIPRKITADDDVLHQLAAGKITVEDAKFLMSNL